MVEKLRKKQGRSFPQHPHGHTAHPLRWKPRHAAASAAPRPQPGRGTLSSPRRAPLSPSRAHLYLSAAPVTDPPHPNARDYKSRQPPRPRQTLTAGGAPRCTLGLVVLPHFAPALWRSGGRGALERAAAEAAVPGSGRQPTPFSAPHRPGSSLFSSHVRRSPVNSPPSAHRVAAAAPGGHLGCGGAGP